MVTELGSGKIVAPCQSLCLKYSSNEMGHKMLLASIMSDEMH